MRIAFPGRTLARGVCRVLAALGLLVAFVTVTPVVKWWGRALGGSWDDPAGDVLIVLGAETVDNKVIGLSSYWRCVYAARVWREGGFREVVVSGEVVAPLMRDFLVSQGVPASVIRVEKTSSSTRENAQHVAALLAGDRRRLVLMTSDFHMFRAYRCFRKAGLNVLPRPLPDSIKMGGLWRMRWSVFLHLLIETLKIVYYFAHGWI